MTGLTDFQVQMRDALVAALGERKLHYSTDQSGEDFDATLIVRCAGVEAFILFNEAEWRLGMRCQPFDQHDFESPEELISKFVAEVVEIARTGFPPQKSAGSTGSYFR